LDYLLVFFFFGWCLLLVGIHFFAVVGNFIIYYLLVFWCRCCGCSIQFRWLVGLQSIEYLKYSEFVLILVCFVGWLVLFAGWIICWCLLFFGWCLLLVGIHFFAVVGNCIIYYLVFWCRCCGL
jgi:hypothetical protein